MRPTSTPVHHILVLQCTSTQRNLIERFHTYLYAYWGVEKTLALIIQHPPNETIKINWTHIRNDVHQYAQSCTSCQEMDARHKNIQASRFVLSTLNTMERIAMDTIGPLPNDMGFKYIMLSSIRLQGTSNSTPNRK